MPGIKKNENANNPHANKYKVPGVSKSIASPFRKNPIPIPRNAKTSNDCTATIAISTIGRTNIYAEYARSITNEDADEANGD